MSEPVPPTKSEIGKAAVMRADGLDWDATAAQLGQPADHACLWPMLFPETWLQCFRFAAIRHVQTAAVEAVQVLRSQLRRSKCEKTQLAIAKQLLRHHLKLRELELRGKRTAYALPGLFSRAGRGSGVNAPRPPSVDRSALKTSRRG